PTLLRVRSAPDCFTFENIEFVEEAHERRRDECRFGRTERARRPEFFMGSGPSDPDRYVNENGSLLPGPEWLSVTEMSYALPPARSLAT
ncbi:MAG TPA: hypothetical protein VFY57_07050, partial [Rubrobacteraceae bacterium]|nr:hypothetical protein [Rubrobacteraceae bacterium]